MTSPSQHDRIDLGDIQIHFNNYFLGTIDPTYNVGFTSILLLQQKKITEQDH